MTIIGTFKQEENGYSGKLQTLTHDIPLLFVPTDAKSDRSPAFLITRGTLEVGAAWRRKTRDNGRPYLSVQLDDPTLTQPIQAGLFPVDGEKNLHHLVWTRNNSKD